MREIKFRGRDGDDWYYGSLFVNECGHTAISAPKSFWMKPVNAETVGQFTGHYDVYGTEIYEGDILDGLFSGEKCPAVAEWDEDAARFILVREGDLISFDKMGGYEITVIGNVHDNPNLLGADNARN